MIDILLNHCAASVLDDVPETNGSVTVEQLRARLATESTGMVGELVSRLDLPMSPISIDVAVLVMQATREAELCGDNVVRCEHLVLGWLRSLGDLTVGADLATARAQYLLLRADWAFTQYEKVTPLVASGSGHHPVVVLVAGVPGTGKSTVAESLGRALNAPVFSMDWQLGALAVFGVLRPENTGPLAELMLTAAVSRQLHL